MVIENCGMYRMMYILVVTILLAFLSASANSFDEFRGMDSLNVTMKSSWSYGRSFAIAYDTLQSLCFLGSGGGVLVVDISNPTAPVKVSQNLSTIGKVSALFYDESNRTLYIAASHGGFEIWDVTNPSLPSQTGVYRYNGDVINVTVANSYAYLLDPDSGLVILDISDPTNPTNIGGYNAGSGKASGLYVDGNYAYIAWNDLRIIDITDPSNPILIGYWSDLIRAVDVCVQASYAYMSMDDIDSCGIIVIDVSTPTNPYEVGCAYGLDRVSHIEVRGDYAYGMRRGQPSTFNTNFGFADGCHDNR